MAALLVEAAGSVGRMHGKNYMAAQHARLMKQRGMGRAQVAVARIILVSAYWMLKRDEPYHVLGVDWHTAIPYYYLVLFWALAGYFLVKYLVRTPFGIALQGIRDNPRRMNALGFNVTAHRVAAYAVAGLIAAVGGVLLVWYNGLITPGSVGTSWLINILIIAVLGGMRHPIGPFLGAIVFVLLQNFAIDVFDRERFNLVIGGMFLAIVLFSPDGLLGLWSRLARALRDRGPASRISTPRPASRA